MTSLSQTVCIAGLSKFAMCLLVCFAAVVLDSYISCWRQSYPSDKGALIPYEIDDVLDCRSAYSAVLHLV